MMQSNHNPYKLPYLPLTHTRYASMPRPTVHSFQVSALQPVCRRPLY